jgi:hypothetical protein
MAMQRNHLRAKASAAHRQSAVEQLGLHAAILLLALSAVLVRVAG